MLMRGIPTLAAGVAVLALAAPAPAQATSRPAPVDRPVADQAAIDRLVQQLGAARFTDRERAEGRLLAIGPDCLPRLRHWLRRPRLDNEVRVRLRRLCVRLGWLDPVDAVRLVRQARDRLLHRDPRVRKQAQDTIARVGHVCMDVLRRLAVADPDYRVRRAVADVLPRVWSRQVPELLIAQLGDKDSYVRLGAASALQRLTGQTHPSYKLAAWKAWWAGARATWRPPVPRPRPPVRPQPRRPRPPHPHPHPGPRDR